MLPALLCSALLKIMSPKSVKKISSSLYNSIFEYIACGKPPYHTSLPCHSEFEFQRVYGPISRHMLLHIYLAVISAHTLSIVFPSGSATIREDCTVDLWLFCHNRVLGIHHLFHLIECYKYDEYPHTALLRLWLLTSSRWFWLFLPSIFILQYYCWLYCRL